MSINNNIKIDFALELLTVLRDKLNDYSILTEYNPKKNYGIFTLKIVNTENYDHVGYIRFNIKEQTETKIIFLLNVDTTYSVKSDFDSQNIIDTLLIRYKNKNLLIKQTFTHYFIDPSNSGSKEKIQAEFLKFSFEFPITIKFDYDDEYYFSNSQYIQSISHAVLDSFQYIESLVNIVELIDEKYSESLYGL